MEDGLAFERKFVEEVSCFKNAQNGVNGNDVHAALLLREVGETELLRLLHQRKIVVACEADDATVDELIFRVSSKQ